MGVLRIDALCECEACQKVFGVELDLACLEPDLLSGSIADFYDLVRDEVRGGQATTYVWGVRGKSIVDRLPLTYWPTVQGGLLLCDECSRKCDDAPIEGALTREQVERVLRPPEPEYDEDDFACPDCGSDGECAPGCPSRLP